MNLKCKNYFIFSFGCLFFVWMFLFAFPGNGNAIKELVGGWLFDEAKGDIAKDVSGNGHDGKMRNAKWVEGKFGKALEFGPSDSVVVIPHSDDFTLEFFTITGWVKCKVQADWQTIITKTGVDSVAQPRNYGTFVVPNDGGIHFSLQTTKINSKEKVTDGNWHYVVMTRDNKGTLRGYIDGKLVVESDSIKPGVNQADVSIGAGGGGTRYWMIGSIDECAIFNRALSEDEIKGLMNKGMQKFLAVDAFGKLAITWGSIKY
jgi:hypothetical protein